MKFLSKKEVKAKTLYSDAHRARLEEAGRFPKRVRLGVGRYCRVGYVEAEVDEWIEQQISKRDKKADAASRYALQRSELLDSVTCNFCLSVDGRIVEKDDPFAQNSIFHSNCRGIWVAIMKDEAELPKISGVPQSLRDKVGDAVNDLVQPKAPIVKKDSAARKEADGRS